MTENLIPEGKLLSPMLDVVFQAMFGEVGKEERTKDLLEAILDKKINEVDLSQNTILRREYPDEKMGILDVLVKIDGKEQCDIEMQLLDRVDIIERVYNYLGRLYSGQVKKGDSYLKMEKTIVILIANFEIPQLKEAGYHSSYWMTDKETRKIVLSEKLEVHIIELPKVPKDDKEKTKLLGWANFFIDPSSERTEEYMGKEEEIKKAYEELERVSGDEKMRRLAELRLKAIMDEESLKYASMEEGRRKGILEGIKEGKKAGIKAGKIEGEKKKAIEIAKNFLKMGLTVEQVEEGTGLEREKVEKIRKEIKAEKKSNY